LYQLVIIYKKNYIMPLKFKFAPKSIIWQLSFVPLIFISLVHCTTKVPEQQPLINNQAPHIQNPQSNQTYPPIQRETKISPTIRPVTRNNPQNQVVQDFVPIQNSAVPSIKVVERDNSFPENLKTCPGSRIQVDISEQQLYLYCRYRGNEVVKTYRVSTAKNGIGNRSGSGKTPLGRHLIKDKIGDGALLGTIFKARRNTGRIATMNQPGPDFVTTRIMWLKGLEPGINAGRGIDSYKRYIYIHGTAEENKIGQPASHGCIRMYNREVIELFDLVTEGTLVDIQR
jgi:hypothetical protein